MEAERERKGKEKLAATSDEIVQPARKSCHSPFFLSFFFFYEAPTRACSCFPSCVKRLRSVRVREGGERGGNTRASSRMRNSRAPSAMLSTF